MLLLDAGKKGKVGLKALQGNPALFNCFWNGTARLAKMAAVWIFAVLVFFLNFIKVAAKVLLL